MSPCIAEGDLVVCMTPTWSVRRVRHCPTCDRRRRFVATHRGVWYPMIWTCCACGDSWCEGELLPRPFRPRWRDDESRRARQKWATAITRDEARTRLRAELDLYVKETA